MANLTITVDDATLKKARLRAIQRDESVNAYLADSLRRYADATDAAPTMTLLLELASEAETHGGAGHYGSGAQGRTWTRDELHRG